MGGGRGKESTVGRVKVSQMYEIFFFFSFYFIFSNLFGDKENAGGRESGGLFTSLTVGRKGC